MPEMKKGIIIVCLLEQQYACAAANLALSIIINNPGTSITLLTDGIHQKVFRAEHYAPFHFIQEIQKEDFMEAGQFSPAKVKLNLSKYSNYEQTIYIDADSLCLGNIDGLFDKLKGSEFKSIKVDGYTGWATPEYFKEFFQTELTTTINTSFIYFETGRVFNQANIYFEKRFDKEKLSQKWGKLLPDELFFNASISKLNVDVSTDEKVMYLDVKGNNMTISGLKEYSFISYYGNQNHTSLLLREWYDKEMFRICEHFGIKNSFKMHEIISKKHINNK